MQKYKKIEQYQLLQLLGKGANGMVYKGLNTNNGSLVAIKEMLIGKQEVGVIKTQLNMLKELDHPCIVKYIDALQKQNRIYLILEFMEGGSLAALVKKNPLSEQVAKIYIKQVLKGLIFLHKQSVIHRDIKGANLLATKNGLVKLADFGVAVKLKDSQKAISAAGSPYWMPPQIISSQAEPSTKCDIWSLGCTVIELLTGNPPYFQLMQFPALFRIVEDLHPPLPECSIECKQFLLMCFCKNPKERATALELLNSSWLKTAKQLAEQPIEQKIERLSLEIQKLLIPTINYSELQSIIKQHKNSLQICKHKYFQAVIQDTKSGLRLPFIITLIVNDYNCVEFLFKIGIISQQFDKLKDKSENEEFVANMLQLVILLVSIYCKIYDQFEIANLQGKQSSLGVIQILQFLAIHRCLPSLAKLLHIFAKEDKKELKCVVFSNIHKLVTMCTHKDEQEKRQIYSQMITILQQAAVLKEILTIHRKDEKDLSSLIYKLEIMVKIIPCLIYMCEIKNSYKKYLAYLSSQLLKTKLQLDTEPISINKFMCLIQLMNTNQCKIYLQKNGFIYLFSEYFKHLSFKVKIPSIAALFQSVSVISKFIKNKNGGVDINRVLQFYRHGGTESLQKIYDFVLSQAKNQKKQRTDGSLVQSLHNLIEVMQNHMA